MFYSFLYLIFFVVLPNLPLFSSLQFLEDVLSSVVKILVHRERLQGWQLDRMGDVSMGVKLLAEQMCSELKASGTTCSYVTLTVHRPSSLIHRRPGPHPCPPASKNNF